MAASIFSGSAENYVASSGATALTFDTAANIVANIQQAVATAFQASYAAGGTPSVSPPPPGVPNLFNLSFEVGVRNTNAGTLTLALGAGITLGNGLLTVLTANERIFLFTVTGPNSITINDLGASAVI